jgi:hypothetical protein
VSREKNIGWLNQWLRKNLKCDAADSVVRLKSCDNICISQPSSQFVYIQHSFSPALDTDLGTLYDVSHVTCYLYHVIIM